MSSPSRRSPRDRKAGHWLSGPGSEAPERRAIADAYDAIVAAAELFALHTEHRHALSFETPGDLLAAYQQEPLSFDRLYRRFCTQAKPATGSRLGSAQDPGRRGRAGLRPGLPAAAGDRVESAAGRGLPGAVVPRRSAGPAELLRRQHPARTSPESERKRAFVIISDAFRYEAAKELTESLNGRYRMNAELSAMLGVLPSYTALGMASLLPHKTLAYNDKGDVLVDGKPAAGTEARNKQLATVEGMACQAQGPAGDEDWKRPVSSPRASVSSTSTTTSSTPAATARPPKARPSRPSPTALASWSSWSSSA